MEVRGKHYRYKIEPTPDGSEVILTAEGRLVDWLSKTDARRLAYLLLVASES